MSRHDRQDKMPEKQPIAHTSALTFSPLTLSLLGLVVLGASGWIMRKQLASASMPAIKQVTALVDKPWVKPLLSWLHDCPYQITVSSRMHSH